MKRRRQLAFAVLVALLLSILAVGAVRWRSQFSHAPPDASPAEPAGATS
jgi:hypothetical protein